MLDDKLIENSDWGNCLIAVGGKFLPQKEVYMYHKGPSVTWSTVHEDMVLTVHV